MKCLCVLSFVVLLAAANADLYSSENDDFDIEAAVADTKYLKSLVGCFLDNVTCDKVGTDFKKDLAEATNTACVKCTDAQKRIYHVFLDGLKTKLPQDYEAFKNKYDPEGKHFADLEKAVGSA